MKMMQVFEPWTDMPMDIRDSFFKDTSGISNDCYVMYCVEPEKTEEVEGGGGIHTYDPVTFWLLDRGCYIGEQVLIKHSW